MESRLSVFRGHESERIERDPKHGNAQTKKTLKVRPMKTIVMVKLMEVEVLPDDKSVNFMLTFVECIVVKL
jgi:hypothetical protein